jgi:hypothetical protein
MATAALATTVNTPTPELRPAPLVRILVIEDDAALRMILQRFLSDEGYAVEIVSDVGVGLEIFAKKCRPQWSTIHRTPHLRFVIFSGRLQICPPVCLC